MFGNLRKRKWWFTVLFSLLLLPALLSCSNDSDLSDDLDYDFTSQYTFYSHNPELYDSYQFVKINYPIGTVLTQNTLPGVSSPEFFAMKPGYKIENWTYLKNPQNGSKTLPENMRPVSDDSAKIDSITVTSDSAWIYVDEDDWDPITYYIEFNGNGATDGQMETQKFTYDGELYDSPNILTANAFTRDSYDFVGWGESANQSPVKPSFTNGETVKRNLANVENARIPLYALWMRSNVMIVFDSNADDGVGGEVKGTMEKQKLAFLGLPMSLTSNSFERDGHTFKNWNTAKDGSGDTYSDGAKITSQTYPNEETQTLYAQWEIIHYDVNFDSTGGSWVDSQKVEWNQKAEKPENPTRTGYDFLGWDLDNSVEGELLKEFNLETTTITNNLTLYAKWKPQTLTIIYDANGGTGSMNDVTVSYPDLLENPVYLSMNAFDFSSEGYYFTNWNTRADGNGNLYYESYEINAYNWNEIYRNKNVDGGLKLYAQWDNHYSVWFDTMGGETDSWDLYSQWIVWQEKVTTPTSNPTKAGYIFGGWYSSNDGGMTLDDEFDFNTPVTENLTIYAKWNSLTLTITFDANGGVGSQVTQTVTGDDLNVYPAPTLASASTFTLTGYDFMGWSKSKSAETKSFDGDEEITSSNWNELYAVDGVTLYAVWKIQEFIVSFVTNGGTAIPSQIVKYNGTVDKDKIATPTRTGYEFKGWYADSGFATVFDFNNTITDNTIIYAKWEAETLKVTFEANGGSGSMSSQDFSYDTLSQNLTANVFTKDGHDFAGWNTSADGSGTSYSNRATISTANWAKIRTSKNITLYAQWKKQEFTVTFIDSRNGSELTSQKVKWEETATQPSDPSKFGYTFKGWDSDMTDIDNVISAFSFSTPITANTTVYAKFEPKTFWVTFDGNGSTGGTMTPNPKSFIYDSWDSIPLNEFVRAGYNFAGWALSDSTMTVSYGDNQPINPDSDMTLYAVWTQRATIEGEVTLDITLNEESEQIQINAFGDYVSYIWYIVDSSDNMIPLTAWTGSRSITLNYDDYDDGTIYSVFLIGKKSDGTKKTESASFKVLPKN